MPATRDVSWWLLAGGTCSVTLAGTARLARAEPLVGAFGDGRSYARMARGEPGSPPFHRRVLGPALARRLGGDSPAAFRRVSVPALVATSLHVAALTRRVALRTGAPPARAAAAAVTAGALVPSMPHGVRLAVQVPEFNDPLAGALGTGWLLLLTGGRGAGAAPPVALAAALAREQWAVVVPVVLTAARPTRAGVLGHAAALAVAGAVLASRPAGPGSEVWGPCRALRRIASVPGVGEVVWAAGFVPGGLLLLLPPVVRAARRAADPVLPACLAAAAAQVVLGHLGGTDLPRLDSGALVPLLPALLGVAAAGGAGPVVVGLAATLPAWRPLTPLRPTEAGYEAFYLPYMAPPMRRRLLGDAARRLAGLAAAGLALAAPGVRSGPAVLA